MTVLTFGAGFIGLGLTPMDSLHAALLASCVGLGSFIWHCILVGAGGIMHEKLSDGALGTITKLSTFSLLGLSLWMIVG